MTNKNSRIDTQQYLDFIEQLKELTSLPMNTLDEEQEVITKLKHFLDERAQENRLQEMVYIERMRREAFEIVDAERMEKDHFDIDILNEIEQEILSNINKDKYKN